MPSASLCGIDIAAISGVAWVAWVATDAGSPCTHFVDKRDKGGAWARFWEGNKSLQGWRTTEARVKRFAPSGKAPSELYHTSTTAARDLTLYLGPKQD